VSLTVIIPALNAAASLEQCLVAVGTARTIVVVDGGSTDATTWIAARFGTTVITAPRGRGTQLRRGAEVAATDWMLFLHADTVLDGEWPQVSAAHMQRSDAVMTAAVFKFALDDPSPHARRLEKLVAWRTRVLGLPYGDQGLLIHRSLYESVGGFKDMPLMEDIDIIRRIGKRRLYVLEARAITSAARWQKSGWLRRSARNLFCVALYFIGVPPAAIAKVYGR
jgi:rSAM/selenodomain-associated transferase 2